MWPFFYPDIERHQDDVATVTNDHDHCFPPLNLFVHQNDKKNDDGQPVKKAIPRDRIPIQRNALPTKKTADRNDTKNVENGAAHDGADAQVALGDEGAHDVGEQLGGGGAGRHKGGARHIVGHVQRVADLF